MQSYVEATFEALKEGDVVSKLLAVNRALDTPGCSQA